MNIDDRLAAITMNLELLSRDREEDRAKIHALFLLAEELFKTANSQQQALDKLFKTADSHQQALDKDAEAIRALARVAENHERRLARLEPPAE